MRDLPDNSVDSVVCDPPYHLTSIHKRFAKCGGASRQSPKKAHQYQRLSRGFMGQTWDGGDVAFRVETWTEVLRVLKPGGHLVAFSGTRTYHRMAVAIEDAGFEVRDQLAWVYGSGFPKSHDLGDGWGTALKPSWEPIALCRKPLEGTNAANMAKHGVGGLNIDACRIEGEGNKTFDRDVGDRSREQYRTGTTVGAAKPTDLGRWPANLCHDGSDEVLGVFPDALGQLIDASTNSAQRKTQNVYGAMKRGNGREGEASADRRYADRGSTDFAPLPGQRREDSGSAARFFYCAKATTEERGEGNNHPTVKPVALMRWLCRLVTPKGGTVLDPFMGSGSTALACDAEQFNFIGCELSADYAAIAERRIRDAAGMFADISIEHTGPRTRAA
jgi:site-specific DNA-methyltransferase (adenine-specific)